MANNVSLLRLRETLIDADSFGEAWDELIATVALLDCHKVEMQLKPECSRSIHRVMSDAPPRSTFPCWRADGPAEAPPWSWTIPLAGSNGVIGALVMDFDPGQESLGFEPAHLLDAITKGFSLATRRFLTEPLVTAEPRHILETTTSQS